MRPLVLLALAPFGLAAPVLAQTDTHTGHDMGAMEADEGPSSHDHTMVPAAGDADARHDMPGPAEAMDAHADTMAPSAMPMTHDGHDIPMDDHTGHAVEPADDHAGHSVDAAPTDGMEMAVGSAPPPSPPTDHAADRFYPAQDMAAARAQLLREHGDLRWSQFMLETFEYRPSNSGDLYAWEGRASFGGDINRGVIKSEGEGEFGGPLEQFELQGLYSRAISPYFNLQAGLRHDFEPGLSRTYGVVGVDGLAPYWFELDGALFLSDEGDLLARFEASYDLRITQRVVLEPRAELNFAAQDVPELDIGAGLSDAELGLRLRYELTPALSPYIGVHHEEAFGDTADYLRAAGEDPSDTRFVVGLRAWF